MWMYKHLLFILLIAFAASEVIASNLPSEESVKGVMVVCGGGRQQSFEGDIHAKIELWKQRASANGKASLSDLSALFATLPQGQQVSTASYATYTSCVLNLMKQYVMQDKQPSKATRLIAAASLGYNLGMLNVVLPSQMIDASTPKIPAGLYEYPWGGFVDGAEKGAQDSGAPACPLRGEPENSMIAARCIFMYHSKVPDLEFQGFVKIGEDLAETEFDSDQGNHLTYDYARLRLEEACKAMNVAKAIGSIPKYVGSFSDAGSRVFLTVIAQETRKSYPTTYAR